MAQIIATLLALLSSPVLAGEVNSLPASVAPTCNLSLARVGDALPLTLDETQPTVRVIHPGQPVTMDYVGYRTTITLDRQGVVASIRCA